MTAGTVVAFNGGHRPPVILCSSESASMGEGAIPVASPPIPSGAWPHGLAGPWGFPSPPPQTFPPAVDQGPDSSRVCLQTFALGSLAAIIRSYFPGTRAAVKATPEFECAPVSRYLSQARRPGDFWRCAPVSKEAGLAVAYASARVVVRVLRPMIHASTLPSLLASQFLLRSPFRFGLGRVSAGD